jgi:hopanoid biosynthesis associated RND transporter like protein HpnN
MSSARSALTLFVHPARAYLRVICWLVDTSRRHAWLVLVLALLVTAGAAYFAVTRISINTDTSAVLFRNLPFTKVDRELEQAFPQLRDRILIVIDGDTAGLASQAADRLGQRLRGDSGQIGDVYEPGGGEFFRKNGLLYLDTKELETLTNDLIDAEPLVAKLARDPSLRGMFDLLEEALKPRSEQTARLSSLGRLLRELTATVRSYDQGRFYQLPWANLMGGSGAAGLQGKRRMLMVTPRPGADSLVAGTGAVDAVKNAVTALGLNAAHGVKVQLTGSVVLNQQQLEAVTTGASESLELSLVLVLVFLILGLRSLRMIFATLVVLLIGLVWTVGFAVLAVGAFNLISVSFAVLFVGLGVDFGIQFCMRYYEELGPADHPREALGNTVARMGPALSLAAVAAALSFYSVVPTDYAGIVDLGIIAGTSMFIALVANLTVLPALLVVLRVRRRDGQRRTPLSFGFLPVRRHARTIVVLATIIGALAVPLISRVRFDFNLTKLQNPKAPAVIAFRELEKGPFSPLPIEALEPDLAAAEKVASRVRALKPVSRAISLQSYVPDDQESKLAILQQTSLLVPPSALRPASTEPPPSAHVLSQSLARFQTAVREASRSSGGRDLAPTLRALGDALERFRAHYGDSPAALLELQRQVIGTLPTELADLASGLQATPVTLASLPESLRSQYVAPDGRARIEVFSRYPLTDSAHLVEFVHSVQKVIPNAAGTPVLFVEGGHAVVSAFREASILSLALIASLLIVALRRLGDALRILAPLVLSGTLTVAAMVLLRINFNIANIIVLPLLIGLGVAFGIYFVLRWRSGLEVDAIMRSSTPGAVLFSGLTTLSSFGSLAIAPDPGMAILGRTLALALGIVLVSVLIVLPALLALARRSAGQPPVAREGEQV